MAQYDIKLEAEGLVDLLTNNEKFTQLTETIINQVLDAQMTEHLNAASYVHSDERTGYRNGYRSRHLYTRVGHLNLRVPQTRDGSFSTEIFKRYQRKEQAFVLGLMEMYLEGVSTRKVTKVTEALCGVTFSKSTVSELVTELDAKVSTFKNRRLDEQRYPFIIVDALVIKCRTNNLVRSMSLLVAYGINKEGYREILGLWLGDSESESAWSTLFKDLKSRGLSGVDLVISDSHTGLVKALRRHFQGAAWQRCQVHFMRNVLGHTSLKNRKEMAEHLKTVLYAYDIETARKLTDNFISKYEAKAVKSVACFEEGIDDALTILAYPLKYRQRLRTSNMAERVNEEIRRREKVVRIFPNEESAIRLIGALLADYHDKWISDDRYLTMDEYHEWKKQIETETETKKVINF